MCYTLKHIRSPLCIAYGRLTSNPVPGVGSIHVRCFGILAGMKGVYYWFFLSLFIYFSFMYLCYFILFVIVSLLTLLTFISSTWFSLHLSIDITHSSRSRFSFLYSVDEIMCVMSWSLFYFSPPPSVDGVV